jgi:glycosyltransferase involved in cell wall biosynthesis
MTVTVHEPAAQDFAQRGETAICIPVTSSADLLHRCIQSVAAGTPADVPVLVVDAAPADPALARFLGELDRGVHYMAVTGETDPVALAAAGLEALGEADSVLLASHAVVPDGWLGQLLDAARSDTTIATASALGNNAGLLSVPAEYESLPADVTPQGVAERIAARAPRSRPRTPTADGHCIWISRAALELAGPLDTDFESLRAAIIDLSQRCAAHGLVSIVADDLFVASVLPGLSAYGGTLDVGADRALLERRYPYLRRAIEEGPPLPLARSVSIARQSLRGISVTVDARILRGELSGAQAATLELIEAVHRSEGVRLRVLVDPAIGADASRELERVAPGVVRLTGDAGVASRSDLVHRPYQVTARHDLDLLMQLGERLIVTHLDLIAFHNPTYHASFGHWEQFRRVTRQALSLADRVVFLSRHAAEDAVREDLIEPDRVAVVPMTVAGKDFAATAPRPPRPAPAKPFLLCIGNDFRHKNRLFAIQLTAALRERGWEGSLVLAGAHAADGSSRGDEAAYLARHPETGDFLHELPAVTEAEKVWLYGNAAGIVYPTTYEGFGLIPFEAARANVPCLFAPQASLAELLPADAAVVVPWNPAASADLALPLLRDSPERRRHLELLAEAAAEMPGWDEIVAQLLNLYDETARAPARAATDLAAEARKQEERLAVWAGFEESVGRLVGPGAILRPAEQRALLAVVGRKRLRRPLFWLLRLAYRLGRRSR